MPYFNVFTLLPGLWDWSSWSSLRVKKLNTRGTTHGSSLVLLWKWEEYSLEDNNLSFLHFSTVWTSLFIFMSDCLFVFTFLCVFFCLRMSISTSYLCPATNWFRDKALGGINRPYSRRSVKHKLEDDFQGNSSVPGAHRCYVHAQSFNHVWLLETPWTVAC